MMDITHPILEMNKKQNVKIIVLIFTGLLWIM